MVSLMIHLGDRLGIYAHLDGAGPITAAELAERSGLHERWLLEWLRANAAARLLEYHDGDRFELTDVGALVLARSDSPSFAAAACGEPQAVRFRRPPRRGVRVGNRALVRRPRRGDRAPRGTNARADGAGAARPGGDPRARRRAGEARAGCDGCRRRVWRRARARAPRRGVPRVDVPRLRPLRARDQRGAAAVRRRRNLERRAVPRPRRRPSRRAHLRPRPHVRLHPRHDQTRSRDRGDSTRDQGRRHLARQRHPQLARLRRQPAQPDAGDDVLVVGRDLHVVGDVGGRAVSASARLGFNPEVVDAMARAVGFTQITTHDVPDPANLYYEIRR